MSESTRVRLWPNDPPISGMFDATDSITPREDGGITLGNVLYPSLEIFLPKSSAGEVRAAVLICPGGGYVHQAYTKEGTKVAEKLVEQGVAAFVLRYRLPDGRALGPKEFPAPQQDLLRAIQTVRHRAEEWNVDRRRIGVLGFSAGGHLSATVSTLFDRADWIAEQAGHDEISQVSARPDFAVLMYTLVTMEVVYGHSGARKRLLGEHPNESSIALLSAHKNVSPDTPPMLLITAEDDGSISWENSIMMASAAATHGVPCSIVLFKTGGHGFGLGPPGSECSQWFDLMLAWLKSRKMLR